MLQHNLSTCSKLLEKGLITDDVSEWVATAYGVSNKRKATKLVAISCVATLVKNSAQKFQDFVYVLKQQQYFNEIVQKLSGI